VSVIKKILNNNLFRLFCALLAMAGCAALGAGIAVYEDQSDPTVYVAGYFGKFLMQKYDDMYEYVDVEGRCIPKEGYVALMKKLHDENNIGDYEFSKIEAIGDKYRMRINYTDTETEAPRWMDIYLVRKRDSATQILGEWKVTVDEYLMSDFQVEFPSEMTLYIDGEEIKPNSEYFAKAKDADKVILKDGEIIYIEPETEEITYNQLDTEGNNMTSYVFEGMLKGPHVFIAETPYTNIILNAEIVVNNQKARLDKANEVVKDEYVSRLTTDSQGFISEYYEVVRNRKSSSKDLLTYLKQDDALITKLKKLAKKDQKIIYWEDVKDIDKYTLTNCDFSELTPVVQYMGDNKIKVSYDFTYEYLCSTSTDLYSSYVYTIEGNCATKMDITYEMSEEGESISDISIVNTNTKYIEEEE